MFCERRGLIEGLHMAHGLIANGAAKVYISSRKADACQKACDELNRVHKAYAKGVAIPLPADHSRFDEIVRIVNVIAQNDGKLHILLANAGATVSAVSLLFWSAWSC